MTVRRFRTIEEMKAARWRAAGDPQLFLNIRHVWTLGQRTGVHRFPPGVYKHRTIESWNRLSERWKAASFKAFHERRGMDRG